MMYGRLVCGGRLSVQGSFVEYGGPMYLALMADVGVSLGCVVDCCEWCVEGFYVRTTRVFWVDDSCVGFETDACGM